MSFLGPDLSIYSGNTTDLVEAASDEVDSDNDSYYNFMSESDFDDVEDDFGFQGRSGSSGNNDLYLENGSESDYIDLVEEIEGNGL